MAENHFLNDLVTGLQREPFQPNFFYNEPGDCLEFYSADEEIVADRVSDVITILRSARDDRPVGFQVKGLKALLERHRASECEVEAQGDGRKLVRVRVSFLVTAALRESFRDIRTPLDPTPPSWIFAPRP